eukprot:CAMPEP_0184346196 /NCGR_PEP_ID=MMETSP1089-20130417/14496_1 /TAXON_ID=38269 ORGANISM="Gloeochaete wittrockiana, Strain SAG46.84" /NCGR_SAMPLE_ID=MMETSP1089 /ASSEMBLY_ACC=CAM_ASM_000445 /LENGTH=590 /DNA_ID=CAMNT_0026676777 /DNA_START=329 /DNA_END=2101 /DNA_ORIENTATION=-
MAAFGSGPHSFSPSSSPSPSSTTAASSLFSSSQQQQQQQLMPSSTASAAFSPVIPPPVPQRTLPRMESPTLGRRPQSDIVLPSFNELLQNVQLPSFDPSNQSSASRPVSAPPETNAGAYNSLQRALRVQQQTSAQLPPSQHFFSPVPSPQQQQQAPASPLHHFPQQLSQQLPLPSPSHGSPFLFHQQQPAQQQSPLFGQQEQAPRQRFGTTGGFLPNPSSPAHGFGDQFTRELKQAQQYQQQQFKHEQQYPQPAAPAPSQQQQQQQTQFTYSAPQQRTQGQYDNAVVIPRGGSQASVESSTRGQQQPDMVFGSGQYGDSRHPHGPQLSSSGLQAVPRLPFDSQQHQQHQQQQQQHGQYWQGGANGNRNVSESVSDQYSFVPMFVEPKAPSRSHPPVVLNPHSKKTRSNFPKEIISILKKWLATHWDNPYPSSEDKRILMAQTGLDKKQIINWFINARRRLVLPKKGQISSPSSGPPAILFSDDESDEDGLSDDDLDNGQYNNNSNHYDDDDDSNTEDNDQIMSMSGSHQQYQQQQQQMGSNPLSPRPFHRKAPVRRPSAPPARTSPSQPATSSAVSSLISMRQQAFNPSF